MSDLKLDEIKNELLNTQNMIKDLKKEFKGLIEIQQRLIHERLGVPIPASPKEYGEDTNLKNKIEISDFSDGRIKVSGNTFDYKSAIKEAGQAKWEQTTKSWSLPIESLEKLVENFKDLKLVEAKDFVVNVKQTIKDENPTEGFGNGF